MLKSSLLIRTLSLKASLFLGSPKVNHHSSAVGRGNYQPGDAGLPLWVHEQTVQHHLQYNHQMRQILSTKQQSQEQVELTPVNHFSMIQLLARQPIKKEEYHSPCCDREISLG